MPAADVAPPADAVAQLLAGHYPDPETGEPLVADAEYDALEDELRALLADSPANARSPRDLDDGTVRWGHEVSIGYFPQDHTGAIASGMSAVEWLHQFDPDASRQDIHGLLGQMLFSGEEGLKPTHALSGGETARLLFCRIMLQKPNVLVLDEPTNHLDLEAIEQLEHALTDYPGTVLLVTHDRRFLERFGATRTIEL